jgi:predicted metal-dependent peptidase
MYREKNVTKFNLNMHVHRLLCDEPFFAALSRRVDKRPTKTIPTAGVHVNPKTERFEMLYNPEFFESLTDVEKSDVLKHEFYHLVFMHVTARKPDGTNAKIWNFATDLAINSHLHNLPEGCLMPGVAPFEDYESGLSAEAYLELLKNDENFDPESGETGETGESGESGNGENESGNGENESGGCEGNGQFDSHEGWDEVSGASAEIAKERLKGDIRKAATEASQSSNWGSVSSEVRRDIMDRITTKVDWRKVLRYFIKTSQRAAKKSSMKRINRRYPYIHPGRKTSRTAHIAVSIDQSGSVSDSMLNAFFSELSKLAKYAEFTVIPFDDEVFEAKVYAWKKGESRKWERVMCGGTDFDAPTDYVNARSFDGHIVLTDLCAPKPKASKCQRMWMTTDYYAKNPYFQTNERIIAIDDK